ncbi:MAG TPA: glucose 1-dehydrogenase [Steroidobacteraceae bacterium]|nr:glucose 1-dehydrogenase [Steroidobacteraceae bacterium]
MYAVDLQGKVALVTGGSRGLGRAMALGLASAGADVVVASRKIENCEAVAAQVRGLGRRALAVSAHAGDIAQLDALIEAAYARLGRVDILINNAATNPVTAGLSELTPDLFQKIFDVNTKGPWYLASRLAPRMAAHGGGAIVNVISVAGLKPPARQGFYAATKAALNALTRVMAEEWAPLGIRVNSLALGSYHSDMFDNSARMLPGMEEGARAASVQKRIAATEEVVGSMLYLVSNMSSFTTGTTLVSDGGYLVL